MLTSELIKKLQRSLKVNGDVQVKMTATTLPEDSDSPLSSVFESTIETILSHKDKDNKPYIKLYWQM